MRQIKFRAWGGEKGKEYFVYFDLNNVMDDYFQSSETIDGVGLIHRKEKSLIFQQFTGLLDKNGKEIYEGDVCKYEYRELGAKESSLAGVAEVFYFGASFSVDHLLLNHISHTAIEVIGNIYENPDLLK